MNDNHQDEKLLDYATDVQAARIRAYWEHGSYAKAAAALGVNGRNVSLAFERVRAKAARMGHAPAHDMTHTVPDGFKVKGVSTYYDKDGKPAGQWVKTNEDRERQEAMMREVIKAM